MSFSVRMSIQDILGLILAKRGLILYLCLKPCVIAYRVKKVKVLESLCKVEVIMEETL